MAVLNEAAVLGGEPLRATPELVKQLVAESREQGEPKHGAEIFRRADLNCIACHSISGQGGTIGPPLDAIGSGQPLDFIIGAVLEPNKEVKESYEAIEVTTKDGEVHTGYRLRAGHPARGPRVSGADSSRRPAGLALALGRGRNCHRGPAAHRSAAGRPAAIAS